MTTMCVLSLAISVPNCTSSTVGLRASLHKNHARDRWDGVGMGRVGHITDEGDAPRVVRVVRVVRIVRVVRR